MDKSRIDAFLKSIPKGTNYTTNKIYPSFVSQGLTRENYINRNIKHVFSGLENYFLGNSGVSTFLWDSKLFFNFNDTLGENGSCKANTVNDHYKIYLPFDNEHIENAVKVIVSFLSANQIPHNSKISSKVRFDDFVIRLANKEDVSKLITFINSTPYLKDNLLPANPFAYSKDGVAMASDGHISYNATICSYIAMYINDMSLNNKMDEVCYETFRDFVQNYYKYITTNCSDVYGEIRNNFELQDVHEMADCMSVTELFLKQGDPNFTHKDYLQHRDYALYSLQHRIELINNDFKNYHNMNIVDFVNFTHSCMTDLFVDFMGRDKALCQVYEYIKTGNPSYISNKHGVRDKMIKCNYAYLANQYSKMLGMGYEELLTGNRVNHELLIYNAINETYEKRGYEQASAAILHAINSGDYNYFSRENRNHLQMNVNSNEMHRLLYANGVLKQSNNTLIVDDDKFFDFMNKYGNALNNRL